MEELVTGSVAEYIETASRIGSDRREAERLKARLAEARPSCPLFDTPAIAGKLEAAYREMLDRSAGTTGAKKP
jgi:predicted O-linked N-acetylglucosamine transferase (SPINDLY family)